MTTHRQSLLLLLTILTISIPKPLFASPLPSPQQPNTTSALLSSPPSTTSPPQPNTTSAPLSSPPPPTPTSSASPSPPQQQQQLNNIIDALIGAGDFNTWSNILSGANPATLPLSATFFIPADDTLSTTNIDPFTFPYHIVPQRLSFSDLRLLRPLSRLPTLLPTKSIIITNTSLTNFTLDNILLSHPDLYTAPAVSVHGIATLFDYTTYGNGDGLLTWMTKPSPGVVMPPPPPPPPPQMLGGEVIGGRLWSDAACLCREFPIFFSVVCGVLAFKIHRYPLAR